MSRQLLAIVMMVLALSPSARAQMATCPAPPRLTATGQSSAAIAAPRGACLGRPANSCLKKKGKLCAQDLEIAKIAWKYFENNYHPNTGFVNAVNKYESTTMWDLASSLAATIAANQLGLLDDHDFDARIMKMLSSLGSMPLYRDEVPNKAYHAEKLAMVDYGNQPTSFGIGFSALDLARLGTWLDNLSCMYPRHASAAHRAMHRWSYCRMLSDGQMFGAGYDKNANTESLNQEGRTGYEQYAAHNWRNMGFDMSISGTYKNSFGSFVEIEGVRIPIDVRDPRKLGAFNYVVTESYALEAMEYGTNAESAPLLNAIFEVQRRRWQRTGIVTAVSEDNVDRQPYFVYNTIYAAGSPWNTITDTGKDMDHLKSTSVKAAMSLAVLFPNDPYSKVLFDKVATAYDPEKGWYSGVFEGTLGYNTAITANTNGIILEAMMYKLYGPLNAACQRCGHSWLFRRLEGENADTERRQCFPQSRACTRCTEQRKLTPLPEPPKPAPPPAKPAPPPAKPAPPPAKPAPPPAKPPAQASKPAAPPTAKPAPPAPAKPPTQAPVQSPPAAKPPAKPAPGKPAPAKAPVAAGKPAAAAPSAGKPQVAPSAGKPQVAPSAGKPPVAPSAQRASNRPAAPAKPAAPASSVPPAVNSRSAIIDRGSIGCCTGASGPLDRASTSGGPSVAKSKAQAPARSPTK